MQDRTREIRSLTGLRGVAAVYVVTYHSSFVGVRYPVWSLPVVSHGYLSVDLFFVLSGFVMALSYAGLFEAAPGPRAFGTFLLRRVARIYPLYLVVLCATALLDPPAATPRSGPAFVENLLLLQGVGLADRIVAVSWSIGVEFAVYLVFPLLVLAVRGGIAPAVWAGAACLAIASLADPPFGARPAGIFGPLDVTAPHSVLPLVRGGAEFVLGLSLFRSIAAIRRPFRSGPAASLLLAAIAACLVARRGDLGFVVLTPLLIAALLNDTVVARAFAARPVVLLGELSYAIYLWHMLLFAAFHAALARFSPADPRPPLAAYWLALLCLAWASARLVERPGRRLVRAVERRAFPREDSLLRAGEAGSARRLSAG